MNTNIETLRRMNMTLTQAHCNMGRFRIPQDLLYDFVKHRVYHKRTHYDQLDEVHKDLWYHPVFVAEWYPNVWLS